MRKLTPVLLPALIFCSSLVSSQEGTQKKPEQLKRPSFTTAVYTVLVDVIVTDKSNKHVNDLRPEEFDLYENGVKQSIDSIEVQTESGAQTITAPRVAPAQQAPVAAAPRVNMINFL